MKGTGSAKLLLVPSRRVSFEIIVVSEKRKNDKAERSENKSGTRDSVSPTRREVIVSRREKQLFPPAGTPHPVPGEFGPTEDGQIWNSAINRLTLTPSEALGYGHRGAGLASPIHHSWLGGPGTLKNADFCFRGPSDR